MGVFPNRLIVSPMEDGVNWLLMAPFSYVDDDLGIIIAPVGFLTDGGSIPKLFQNVISPVGKGFRAFVIHDVLYTYKWFLREDADRCLWRMLKELDEPSIEANVIYDAVRIGGGTHWKPQEVPNAGSSTSG